MTPTGWRRTWTTRHTTRTYASGRMRVQRRGGRPCLSDSCLVGRTGMHTAVSQPAAVQGIVLATWVCHHRARPLCRSVRWGCFCMLEMLCKSRSGIGPVPCSGRTTCTAAVLLLAQQTGQVSKLHRIGPESQSTGMQVRSCMGKESGVNVRLAAAYLQVMMSTLPVRRRSYSIHVD